MPETQRSEPVHTFNDMPLLSKRQENSDQPAIDQGEHAEDLLGIENYVRALGDFIIECETPITVGLQGEWGTGKTSMLNLLERHITAGNVGHADDSSMRTDRWSRLKRSFRTKPCVSDSNEIGRKGQIHVLHFNTWQYSLFGQDTYLGISVIQALLGLLTKQLPLFQKHQVLRNCQNLAGRVIRGMSINGGLSRGGGFNFSMAHLTGSRIEEKFQFSDISTEMVRFREEFAKLVKLVCPNFDKDRLVIFVDDLDRIRPGKAIELLESIKNFLDVPGCVFVVAVDYDVIQLGVEDKLGHDLQSHSGKSFFDKLIQLPFSMPTGSYDLGRYLKDLLVRSEFIDAEALKLPEVLSFFTEITYCSIGENPRSIKRVMNYGRLLEKVLKGNLKKQTILASDSTEAVSWVWSQPRDMSCATAHPRSQEEIDLEHRRILYALVCMQIAWPEIFDHLLKHPYHETIRGLENWDYLDSIPHIQKLWKRYHDVEQVKSNIGYFFDILFTTFDTNHDGEIDDKEFRPIIEMLALTQLTSTDAHASPFERFVETIRKGSDGDRLKDTLDAFENSKWRSSSRVAYKYSGNRYGTIVINRRQAGNIISMENIPFALRLIAAPASVTMAVAAALAGRVDLSAIIVSPPNVNMAGFGGTFVDASKLKEISPELTSSSVLEKFFNSLFDFMATHTVEERHAPFVNGVPQMNGKERSVNGAEH